MLVNNNRDTAFNDFSQLSYLPYKIIEILVKEKSEEAEMFWKCLKYAEIDCLTRPDLTITEKKKMVWSGEAEEEPFSVFLKPLIGDSMTTAESQTQLRLYREGTLPITQYDAIICFEIDIISNEKTGMIKYNKMLCEKTDFMENLFLQIFNGRDVEVGSGYLTFDRELTRSCDSSFSISNSKTFYGRTLILGLRYSNMQTGAECG